MGYIFVPRPSTSEKINVSQMFRKRCCTGDAGPGSHTLHPPGATIWADAPAGQGIGLSSNLPDTPWSGVKAVVEIPPARSTTKSYSQCSPSTPQEENSLCLAPFACTVSSG